MNKRKRLVTVIDWPSARRSFAGRLALLPALRSALWLLLMLCFFGGATLAQGLPAGTPPKSITVVMDDNYPPFIFRDANGQAQGILKDSWALWQARTGIAVQLQTMDWAKALQLMQTGQADVIDTIFLTEARRQLYDFSAPYARLDVPIFFHQSISGIVDADSLKGFTVGVKEGDACIDVLRAHGIDSIKKYPSYSAVIAAAASGDLRVFCVDQAPAVYLLNQLGIEKEFRQSVPLYTGEFHRAVRKGNDALLKVVEDGFARISATERQQIERKWYGSAIEGPGIPLYARYAGYALVGVLLIAMILALWNLTLRRRVRAKTAELSNSLVALGNERRITEQTLAQINATLKAIPDLWFELDLDGRYHNVHAARSDLPIPPRQDLLGKLVSEVMPPDAAAVVMAALQEADESGYSTGKEFALNLLQSLQWFELSIARKATLADEAPSFVVLARDITEKKLAQEALRESEERYRTAFMTSPDAVNLNRLADGLYLDVNDGFQRLMGWSRDEVIGQTSLDINVWQNPQDRQRLMQTLQRVGYFENLEINFVAKDGRVIAGLMSAHQITIKGEQCILSVTRDVTARKQAEDALRVAAAAFDAQEGIFVTDPVRVILQVNKAFTEITGYSAEEAIGKTRRQLNAGRNDAATSDAIAEGVMRDGKWQGEVSNRRKNGDVYTEWLTVTAVVGNNGKLTHYVGTLTDISARKATEHSLQLAASVFSHTHEGIMIAAADGNIIEVNEAFSRITGYRRDEVLGKNPRLLSSGRQTPEFYAAMWRDLTEQGHWHGEVWNQRKNGEVYPQRQDINAVRDDHGNIRHYVSLFSDISALKAQQQQLEHLAHFDVLTSLPNRVLLADRLRQAVAQTQRRGQTLAVAYLDLDGFKVVNDHHGHEVGDQLLISVATRMKQALREGDTLARLGGDEFVAVLLDLTDVAASVPLLTRLLAAAAQSVQLGGLSLHVSASVGVTFYPQQQDIDADQLLRQADQAMYQAKLAGKNRFHFFDAEQDSSIRGHHESVERIRQALTEREFVLYYQPKVNMRSGAVLGVEALIRWRHPEQGLLPPALFLPVIEDHPLAVDVGEWAIDSALRQMELWQASGLDIPISVNVGGRQLQQANFVPRLRDILAAHPDVKPDKLELEVLETSALEDLERVSQVIESCRSLGVSFALDDFGTGYSSLTYLKHLRVTLLKIDRSFVRDMLDDRDDLAILEGVIGLASAFRCQVIAEGVETVAHGALLLQLGCELAQGYCIARPMLPDELPGWLASWRPDPAWVDLPRVSRDNLPVLRAAVAYRAWIAAVGAFLKGEREVPPPIDPQQIQFGKWLGGEGLGRHGAQPAWQAIEALHREAQALAAELLELQASGRKPQAMAQLDKLHGLRDLMLGQLTALEQESRPGDLMI